MFRQRNAIPRDCTTTTTEHKSNTLIYVLISLTAIIKILKFLEYVNLTSIKLQFGDSKTMWHLVSSNTILHQFMFACFNIVIITFITCNWQTPGGRGHFTYYIIYARIMKVHYLRVQVGRTTCEACSGNWEVSGTIPAFALVHRETEKNLCRYGRSQDLPDNDF